MPLSKDLREFVELLNSNRVEYLIVGAFAVAYHGFPRYTGDLDIKRAQAGRRTGAMRRNYAAAPERPGGQPLDPGSTVLFRSFSSSLRAIWDQ
jgi:hypothetical protein